MDPFGSHPKPASNGEGATPVRFGSASSRNHSRRFRVFDLAKNIHEEHSRNLNRNSIVYESLSIAAADISPGVADRCHCGFVHRGAKSVDAGFIRAIRILSRRRDCRAKVTSPGLCRAQSVPGMPRRCAIETLRRGAPNHRLRNLPWCGPGSCRESGFAARPPGR